MSVSVTGLPWARRARADAHIRRAIQDLRHLAVEDTVFTEQYRAMADTFENALDLLDAIDASPGFSRKVRTVL